MLTVTRGERVMDKKVIDKIQGLLDLRDRVENTDFVAGNIYRRRDETLKKDIKTELLNGTGSVLIDVKNNGFFTELSPFEYIEIEHELPILKVDQTDAELLFNLVQVKSKISEEYRSAILKVIDHRLSVLKSKI